LSQGRHDVDPSPSWCEFLGHLSHDDSPLSGLYVPGWHLMHVSLDKIPPVIVPCVPSAQSLHFVFPVSSFYFPSLQGIQLVVPSLSWDVPLGQSYPPSDPLSGH